MTLHKTSVKFLDVLLSVREKLIPMWHAGREIDDLRSRLKEKLTEGLYGPSKQSICHKRTHEISDSLPTKKDCRPRQYVSRFRNENSLLKFFLGSVINLCNAASMHSTWLLEATHLRIDSSSGVGSLPLHSSDRQRM